MVEAYFVVLTLLLFSVVVVGSLTLSLSLSFSLCHSLLSFLPYSRTFTQPSLPCGSLTLTHSFSLSHCVCLFNCMCDVDMFVYSYILRLMHILLQEHKCRNNARSYILFFSFSVLHLAAAAAVVVGFSLGNPIRICGARVGHFTIDFVAIFHSGKCVQ